MSAQYVKPISDGWEVKLGPGQLPFVVTQSDLNYVNSLPTFGTFAMPTRQTIDDFNRLLNGVAAVREYLANHA